MGTAPDSLKTSECDAKQYRRKDAVPGEPKLRCIPKRSSPEQRLREPQRLQPSCNRNRSKLGQSWRTG